MTAEIFDITVCPTCNGEKEIECGQVMKDARVYAVKAMCSNCKGKGRIGVKRQKGVERCRSISQKPS